MVLVLLLSFSASNTAVFAQAPTIQAGGQDCIVKSGDSLVEIATAFYGQAREWRTIFEATNAKAASDPSYAHIAEPQPHLARAEALDPSLAAAAPDMAALNEAYARAVKDAEVAEPGEISRKPDRDHRVGAEPGLEQRDRQSAC